MVSARQAKRVPRRVAEAVSVSSNRPNWAGEKNAANQMVEARKTIAVVEFDFVRASARVGGLLRTEQPRAASPFDAARRAQSQRGNLVSQGLRFLRSAAPQHGCRRRRRGFAV